jgi:signal peptidase II
LARAYTSLVIGACVVVADQTTKQIAIGQLGGLGPDPSMLDGWVTFTLTRNQGAAFGVLAGSGLLFVFIALIVAVVIAGALAFYPIRRASTLISLGLQLGGAAGNLVDRVRQNYVVDFIHVSHWPIFNVADASIVCGSLLLMYVWISGAEPRLPSSSAPDLIPDQ